MSTQVSGARIVPVRQKDVWGLWVIILLTLNLGTRRKKLVSPSGRFIPGENRVVTY